MPTPAPVSDLPLKGKLNVFDERPIQIGGFELRARGARPVGKPDLDGWRLAFEFASAAEASAPYWVGDLIAYADTRAEWSDRMDQAKAVTGLAHHTLQNLASVSRNVQATARALAPTHTHARAVADLEPAEQEALLTQAQTENLTVAELLLAKRLLAGRTVASGQAPMMHTVEVTVRVAVEADSPYAAEQAAWALVKRATAPLPHTHVVASHVLRGAPLKKATA